MFQTFMQQTKLLSPNTNHPTKLIPSETPIENNQSLNLTTSPPNQRRNAISSIGDLSQGKPQNINAALYGVLKQSIKKFDKNQNVKGFKNILRTLTIKTRTDRDNKELLDYCKEMHFFKEFLQKYMKDSEQAALIKFVSEMTLEECPAQTIIFKENDPSNNKMYIIQDGSVTILKEEQKNVFEDDYNKFIRKNSNAGELDPTANKPDEEKKPVVQKRNRDGINGDKLNYVKQKIVIAIKKNDISNKKIAVSRQASMSLSEANNEPGFDEQKEEEQTWLEQMKDLYGQKVCELKTGFMFGELALLNTKPRGATILTEVDCKFIILRKKQFDYIKKFYSSEMVFKREFLFNVMPKLDEINADKYVTDILINFANDGLTKGAIVTKQDLLGDRIYFLSEGICKIQYRLASEKLMTICEVSAGTVIGEESLFNMDNKYTFTVVVQSQEAKFLTLYRKYMQKSIPFSTLEDLKNSYDMKEKARMNYIEKQDGDKDLIDILDANSRIYVREPLMGVNRRKSPKKSKQFKQVTIEQNIEHRKYFQVNFQRNQNFEEVRWSAAMMAKLQKKSPDEARLDLEAIQNWRIDQQKIDPVAFKKKCEDTAARLSRKKTTMDPGVNDKKEDVPIAKAQILPYEQAEDNPLWDLDVKDIFDEPEKEKHKNQTKIDKKYKKDDLVNFIPMPDVCNVLQERVRNIKPLAKSCNFLPEDCAEGKDQNSKLKLQQDFQTKRSSRSVKSLNNFKVRSGSPIKPRTINIQANSLASLEIDTKTNVGQDLMNVSPLMKKSYKSQTELSLKLNSVKETYIPEQATQTYQDLKPQCSLDNFEAFVDGKGTQPIIKSGGKTSVTLSKSINNIKKILKSNNPIDIFKPFGQGAVNNPGTMGNIGSGKNIGLPFQEITSQRYEKQSKHESDTMISPNSARDKIYGIRSGSMTYCNNQVPGKDLFLKTDVFRTGISKKEQSTVDVNFLKSARDKIVLPKTIFKKKMNSSTKSPRLFYNDCKNDLGGYIFKKDIIATENIVDLPLDQKYDNMKNSKMNSNKSTRRYSSTLVNIPTGVDTKIKKEQKQLQDELKSNTIIKRNSKTGQTKRSSKTSLNKNDFEIRKSIENVVVSKIIPYGIADFLKSKKSKVEPEKQVKILTPKMEDFLGIKNHVSQVRGSLKGCSSKTKEISRFEVQKKDERLRNFTHRKSKESV